MATVIAVIAALGAACCFTCAAVVQHRAARDAGGTALSPALLLRLARNPRWLAASALRCPSRSRDWRWPSGRWRPFHQRQDRHAADLADTDQPLIGPVQRGPLRARPGHCVTATAAAAPRRPAAGTAATRPG
ncbi:MAG TPA: hypothetical protein VIK57_24120 [Streptosporangiaceae bacterium]